MIFGGRRLKRAAVLGCGPAGLFATHALIQNGWSVAIFSKNRKSHMFGAQYLHSPIAGLTESYPIQVRYRLTHGTVEDYRAKVYGVNPVTTSVETLAGEHDAWDIREAYDNAWNRYSPLITEANITPEWLGITKWDPKDTKPIRERNVLDGHDFSVIVNSIPLPDLCYGNHEFHSASVWAMGDAPSRGQYAPYRPLPNTVECNASRDTGWYRASNIYGHATVEWPANRKPPLPGVAEVIKPISTNCVCYLKDYPVPFLRVGRYGEWTKGILSNSAYVRAFQL